MSAAGDRFKLDLRKLVQKVGDKQDLVVRKLILDMGGNLVRLSPVGNPELWAENVDRKSRGLPPRAPAGYVGGRFRANWQYGTDVVPSEQLYNPNAGPYPDEDSVKTAIAAAVPTTGLIGHKHYLVNNLPYAQRLEDGWSTQAPGGMVALTVTSFQAYVDDSVRSLP